MQYRAVNNRCSFDLCDLDLPVSFHQALDILKDLGFKLIDVDICELAVRCIGVSDYCLGAKVSQAPVSFDCSSFVKWLYGNRGIWLPRRTVQQMDYGKGLALNQRMAGDLIFTTGNQNFYTHDPTKGVGHVGILVNQEDVVHASFRHKGVVKETLEQYLEGRTLKGVRRYIPFSHRVVVLVVPPEREIETSDDLRWIILQSL